MKHLMSAVALTLLASSAFAQATGPGSGSSDASANSGPNGSFSSTNDAIMRDSSTPSIESQQRKYVTPQQVPNGMESTDSVTWPHENNQ